MAYSNCMCGITGIFNKNEANGFKSSEAVFVMTEAITHRGPDDSAYYNDTRCGIGMRRLAIVDLTPGLYPFISDDGDLIVTFNGEIYNYEELKVKLSSIGCKFKTNCDGEVILKGYEKWGTGVFDNLRGMFAISIYDKHEQKLILARDRLGIKPLYYTNSSDLFAYSSEVKSLLKLRDVQDIPGGVSFALDPELLFVLLGFMYLPESEETIIKGVKKLTPGCYMEITKNSQNITRYWDLKQDMQFDNISYPDAVDYLDEKLTECVSMHLMSDVPLAVLLSGGLDSALITAIMAKKLNIVPQTYTAKFNHKFNESILAKETSAYLHTDHHEIEIDTLAINRDMENYIELFDDLTTFDGGLLTTKLLTHEIRKNGVKVLLLGEGADELFGGYSWYGVSQLPFNLFPQYVKNALYYYLISRNITFKPFYYTRYWNRKTVSPTRTFNDITYRELFTQLPNHLLMKVDKGAMSESIEARVPYLDHELVEFVYSLPQNFKLAGAWFDHKKSHEKRILRDVARRYLPESVCSRKKKGFLLPMNDVLTANGSKVIEYLTGPEAVGKNILGDKFVFGLFKKSNIPYINMQNEYFKWRLFILEIWAKKYKLTI